MGKNILREVAGKPRVAFHYKDKGLMAMIGRGAAVAEIGEHRHELHGSVAFAAWLGVHAALMSGVRNRVEAFNDWGWDYFSKSRGPQVLDQRSSAARIDWGEPDDDVDLAMEAKEHARPRRICCAHGDEALADAPDFDGTFLLAGHPGWWLRRFPGTRDKRSLVSAGSRSGAGKESQPDPGHVALTRSPGFWRLMGYAALFGVVLAFGSLAFLGLVEGGTDLWFTLPNNPGWLDGSLWWVAVTGAAGLLVGVLRRLFRLPAKLPGTVEELKDQRVEPSTVPKAVAVSLVSLAGGASLGPEDALGKLGGGLGTWVSERKKLSEDMRATNSLTGMSAAYGGLLSAPILATILVLEIARPKAARFSETLVGGLLASSVAFAVYFPIAGSTFVGIYALPSFKYEDWQLLAAVPLGLAAGALALITMVAIAVVARLAARLGNRTIVRSTIGGVAFGLVGVALPLTLFTGTDQLTTVIDDGAALGAGLLIAVVFAKILVFALCEATGFIGGPFLVMLFIGGTAGITAHVLIPGLPEGLAFTAMFAALPGSLVAAPFSLILLGVITTQIGALQVVPVTIAVITAYLAVSGSGLLIALAQRQRKPATSDA